MVLLVKWCNQYMSVLSPTCYQHSPLGCIVVFCFAHVLQGHFCRIVYVQLFR